MQLAHTILIETKDLTIRFIPPAPMELLEIFQSFSSQDGKPIVTCDRRGTARVSMIPDLESVILKEIEQFTN